MELNRRDQTLRITAPGAEVLTLGPKQQLSGRHLSIDNRDAFAVFALLPVDAERIDDAHRLVLMHLTNTQASGMKFGNDKLDRLESWGRTPFLARRNTARVSLRLPGGGWEFHALDTAGKRIARIPAQAQPDGSLRLEIDNFRHPEAVFAYELIRE